MKRYTVTGHAEIGVAIVVEAEDEESAIERAYEEFGGIIDFAGNGGVDKLIGVCGEDESIYADGDVEFDDCMEEE